MYRLSQTGLNTISHGLNQVILTRTFLLWCKRLLVENIPCLLFMKKLPKSISKRVKEPCLIKHSCGQTTHDLFVSSACSV